MAATCDNLKIAKFNLTELWDRTQTIYKNCPNTGKLSSLGPTGSPSERFQSLTFQECTAIAGHDYGTYGKFDIWSRLSTWKFPLFQLIAVFPRPSLSVRVEFFVITHLLGDPIDTMTNLLLKLSDAQEMATYWKTSAAVMDAPAIRQEGLVPPRERLWKALTLVTDTYDEWSMGPRAKHHLRDLERHFRDSDRADAFRQLVIEVAEELAADRVTKILPTAVALILFILTIAVSFLKTRAAVGGSGLNISTFIGVEAHSIAFSALYFWIIPAVFLGSVIGTSQSEHSIPRILKRFHDDLPRQFSDDGAVFVVKLDDERVYTGGIYTWRRQEIAIPGSDNEPHNAGQQVHLQGFPSRERGFWYRFRAYALPYFIVGIALASGASVSARVPPDGLDCRVAFQIGIVAFWILSGLFNPLIRWIIPPSANNRKKLLVATFFKDVFAIIATLGGVYSTVVGVLNKCYCWTKFGTIELVLPQREDVNKILQARLELDYPALIFSGIAIELFLMPGLIWLFYPKALSVFVQKDSDESNLAWWSTIQDWFDTMMHEGSRLVKRPFQRTIGRVLSDEQWRRHMQDTSSAAQPMNPPPQ